MDQSLIQPGKQSQLHIFGLLALIAAAWLGVYNLIQPLADWIAYSALNLTKALNWEMLSPSFCTMFPRFFCY